MVELQFDSGESKLLTIRLQLFWKAYYSKTSLENKNRYCSAQIGSPWIEGCSIEEQKGIKVKEGIFPNFYCVLNMEMYDADSKVIYLK